MDRGDTGWKDETNQPPCYNAAIAEKHVSSSDTSVSEAPKFVR